MCDWLAEKGHDAAHVRDVLTGQAPDSWVANHARQEGRILITKDEDFVLRYPPGSYVLIWLRCGNMSNRRLRPWLDARWHAVQVALDDGESIIEVR